MSQSGGSGGSTTRHIIEVMYQVTGLDKAGAGITSMNKSVTQGQTTLDKYGMSATKASQETTKLATSTKSVAPALDKTSSSTQKLDKSLGSTSSSAKSLGEKFRGNKGLIFSTTMLASGTFEAIGMYQGWTDASDKLAAAQQKVNDLEVRGLENTKEYGDAVRELSDAQRGYNFITRFTIQSFADLIPMSLLMASSLMEMSGNFMKGASMKEKFAAASGKVVGGLKAVGNAMLTFTTRHPLLLLLTLLATAVVAVITNFGGLRDRLNEVGVALGKAVPGLKGFLDWLGQLGNGFTQSAEAAMGHSQTTTKSLKDIEAEVLRTGDATTLSIDEQIAMYGKLGEEAKDVSFSLSAHWKMYQDKLLDTEHKYDEFVAALQSGDEDIMHSMGLTEAEFKEFYKRWEEEIADFDKKFGEHVDTIVENYKKFGELGRSAQTGMIEEMDKLNKKIEEHYKKRDDGEKMDKKARKKWKDDLRDMQDEYDSLTEGISEGAFEAAQAWANFDKMGETALNNFAKEALAGNFSNAIQKIQTASDSVPEKYKGNFARVNKVIDNSFLTAEQKADIFVAHMDKLDPFKSFTVGAHEYTLKQAEVTAGLDELAAAARANVTDSSQMKTAWDNFVASLSPAQKALPIVQSAIAGVTSKALSAEDAFAMVEAAGRTMSATLGDTVTQSFDDLKKTIVDLPGDTSAVFAEINGQVVKVGEVSDQSLITGPKSAVKSMEKTGTQAATLADTFEIEMPKASGEVDTFATDANSFLNGIITTFTTIGTEAAKIPGKLKTALSTESITSAWDKFRNALGETGTWINTGVSNIASYLKGAITIDNFKAAWNGFWGAIAEGKDIIVSGIATLAKTITEDIKLKALSGEWWKGFWDAMSATVTWVAGGITTIGTEIAKSVTTEGPKWWKGFQDALGSTAQWVGIGIQRIGEGITKTITVANALKWWKGFQDALGSTAQWLGTGIKRIGDGITKTITTEGPKWWKGFQDALGSTAKWVQTGVAKIAQEILNYPWAEVGKGILQKIGEGLGGAGKGIQDFFGQLLNGGGKDKDFFTPISMPGQGKSGFPIKNDMGAIVGWTGKQQTQSKQQQGAIDTLIQKFTELQKVLSTLSTSVATYANSMKTNLGGFFTTATASVTKFTPVLTQLQTTFSLLSTSIAAYSTSMVTTIGAWITGSIAAMGNFMPVILQLQQTFSNLSMSIATYSTSMITTIGAWVTASTTSIGAFIPVITLLQTTFSTLSTSVATYMTSMTTTVAAFITASTTSIGAFINVVKLLQGTMSTLSTSVATYMNSMKTNVTSFTTAATQNMTKVGTAAKTLQGSLSSLSKNTATYSNSMKSNLKSFSSSAVSSLNAVASAAKKAESALKSMAAAAAKAKAARSGLRFGGAFVTGGSAMNQSSSFAQQGKSWINSRPRKIGGVNISEFSKPELVTVTPLSNPSDPMDKGLNYLDGLPGPKMQKIPDIGSSGSISSSRNGQPIIVKGEIHITNTMPSGKILSKEIQPFLLEGFSGVTG